MTEDKKGTSKTIELYDSNIIPALEYLLELAKNDEIECFVFGGKHKNGEFISVASECSLSDNMSIVGYLQSLATIRTLNEIIDVEEL